jgi:hypothetical protein
MVEYRDLPPRLKSYYDRPGLFSHIQQAILAHDPSCLSLPDLWLGHVGGVSCPSDISDCDDCGVTFYNEGLMGQYPPDRNWKIGDPVLQTVDDDGDFFEAQLCECCGRIRWEKEASDVF